MSEIQTTNNNVSVFANQTAFSEAQRMAQLLSSATHGVPPVYQNNLPNCVVAIELAQRLNVSPLMIMQNTDIIHGRPAYKSTFITGLINTCGRFSEPLEYEYSGEGETRKCYAWTKRKDGRVVKGTEVSIVMARAEGWYGKNGSKWPTMPDQMLAYRAAAFFSRLHCPDVTIGMQSADEIEDIGYTETAMADKSVISDINAQVTGNVPPPPAQPASDYVEYEDLPVNSIANAVEVNNPETVSPIAPPPPVNEDDF